MEIRNTILITTLLFAAVVNAELLQGSVYVTSGRASFLSGTLDKHGSAAYGTYNDTMMTTGWGELNIRAGFGRKFSDRDLMYAAGYLEGALTGRRIEQHYNNIHDYFLKNASSLLSKLEVFFDKGEEWARHMVKKDAGRTALWRHVDYVLAQFDGVLAGCKVAKTQKPVTRFMLQVLNGIGDFIDLKYALDKSLRPDFYSMSHKEFTRYVQSHGHCSALIKMLPGFENVYVSHSSWFIYSAMLRIYKHYDFNLADKDTASKGMSFSSYPGFIESLDDFYLMSNGLVMIQTTNNVFDHKLYDLVKPESLLAWMRVRVANHLARSAPEWGKIFKQYNSGTYNNQYMVLDLNKIKINKSVDDNALWVVEQIPGFVEYADQTNILRNGHWPSYNVPFYESVYNRSGYPAMVRQHGVDNSYMLAPRAKIFRRDADDVHNMDSMKNIMRYNDYRHDRYSSGDPCKTICCRGDLEGPPELLGCYDTKVSDYFMAVRRQSLAVNGPSPGSGLGSFSWKKFPNIVHQGMPEVFNFDFQFMRPAHL